MCVSCHPTIPSLVAGGTFNGEVIVWDTSIPLTTTSEELIKCSSTVGDYFHREPIAALVWNFDRVDADYQVRNFFNPIHL